MSDIVKFPKWKYHATEQAVIVETAKDEAALGSGWKDSPADFTAYAKAEAKADAKAEARVEAKADAKAAAKVEAKADAKAEAKAKSKTE